MTTSAPHPTYVILGSGGHTAEMCRLTQALLQQTDIEQTEKYQPIRLILANSDSTSERQFRQIMPQAAQSAEIAKVPRSRNVGQSWLSSIFTSLWALLWSCYLVWRDRPQLILCNGPGTCVPFFYAAYLWRLLRTPALALQDRVRGELLPRGDAVAERTPAPSAGGPLCGPLAGVGPTRYVDKKNVRYFGRIL
ncbi:GM19571 [Drosophila sechellia]|uniref:UDP-N-acetylglucosamine transferase subunit ALG14 n=1 Tax=Drosophila sechellia TaxID=7238 RepID=B4ILT8_DROSE|nr:GM19571 [Drosophila sechellia]